MNKLLLAPCKDSDGVRLFLNDNELDYFSYRLEKPENSLYPILYLEIPVNLSWFGNKIPDGFPSEPGENA